jgi:uncharacterized membrane protein
MPEITVTPEFLCLVAGVILSLLFSYVPRLNTWYASKSEQLKKLFMLLLLFIVVIAIFVLACTGLLPVVGFTCTKDTAVSFVYMFILAVISNQSTHSVTPQTLAVKQAKQPKLL